jgi:hypothetical protein
MPIGLKDMGHFDPVRELIEDALPNLLFMIIHEATAFLIKIRQKYEQRIDQIEPNKGDRNGIFDSAEHGTLLIGDASFIRSRRYFWTIDALDIFGSTIETSITTYNRFMGSLKTLETLERMEREKPKPGKREKESFSEEEKDKLLRKREIASKDFEGLLVRIRVLKDRTITLRDGVCICLVRNMETVCRLLLTAYSYSIQAQCSRAEHLHGSVRLSNFRPTSLYFTYNYPFAQHASQLPPYGLVSSQLTKFQVSLGCTV